MRSELKKRMKKYNDPLLYVYENRANKEKVRDKLYELYPDLKVENEIKQIHGPSVKVTEDMPHQRTIMKSKMK
jgi:hypothetical protein